MLSHREDLSGAACAAATIGMRRSPVSANQMLACFGAANETAIDAASESIKHAARWYLAETGEEDAGVFLSRIEDKIDAIWSRKQ